MQVRDFFLYLVDVVTTFNPWFRQASNGLGRLGLSNLQKYTVALHMLVYGIAQDATDDYVRFGET